MLRLLHTTPKCNWILRLLNPHAPLLVQIGQHQRYVRGQQVVHFVPERRLAEQLRAAHQVADGHVEVGVSGRPVRYSGKGVGHQKLLEIRPDRRITETVIQRRHHTEKYHQTTRGVEQKWWKEKKVITVQRRHRKGRNKHLNYLEASCYVESKTNLGLK